MATTTLTKPVTTAEWLEMPDDGMERWLIDGELREKPLTKRNRFHSQIMVRIAQLLGVPLIWIVDPHDKTVLVHRPGELPELFNIKQDLVADPHLPDCRLPVSKIFEV